MAKIIASAWWELVTTLVLSSGFAGPGLWLLPSTHPTYLSIRPSTDLLTAEILLGHQAGNFLKKPSFSPQGMDCSSMTSLLQLGLTSKADGRGQTLITACFAEPVAPTPDPRELCPDGSLIQSIWVSGIFLM